MFETTLLSDLSPAPPSSMLGVSGAHHALNKNVCFSLGLNHPRKTINTEEGGAGERLPNDVILKTLIFIAHQIGQDKD